MLVFGRLPLVSVPANLLAVPVAGVVMLYGMPAGLVAGCVPALAPVVMFPCTFGVRWVDTVSVLGARMEPGAAGAPGRVGGGRVVVVARRDAAMHRGAMAMYLLTGDDESFLRTAAPTSSTTWSATVTAR